MKRDDFKRIVQRIQTQTGSEFEISDDDGRFTATHGDTVITANAVSDKITVRWDVNSNRPHMAMIHSREVVCCNA